MNTSFFQRVRLYIGTHKKTTIVSGFLVLLVGYFIIHAATKKTPAPSYVIGTAQTGTVVATVTDTGQISTSDTVELKPEVSGPLTSVRVKAGDHVSKGQALFTIGATDAARAVVTARDNLASAELDLRATQSQQTTSNTDEDKAVANAYITLLSSNLQPQAADLITQGYQTPTISGNYTLGKEGAITLKTYNSQGGISFTTSGLVEATGLTNSISAQPIGNSGLFVLFPSNIKGDLTWTISIPNTNASSYLSNKNAYETALENQSNNTDPNGTNAVTIQSKQLAVKQAQNNLASAEETLAKYTITSPFDGTVASIPVNVGDQVSSADTLGTVITNQEIATLSLNEVDVSKVSVGQKATLTFDAVDGLTLAGTVATVNPVGTVSSGVVSYEITIALDTQDTRIKSGMTVTAAIQTSVAQDVVTVPAAAVKTTNGSSFVLTVPSNTDTTGTTGTTLATTPTPTAVEVGISDGTTTEIKSGLNAGDKIVTKTITVSTTSTQATTTTAPSLLGGGATRSTGGAAFRATTR